MIITIASIFLINVLCCNAKPPSIVRSPSATPTPQPLDATSGGKDGNAGAEIRFGTPALNVLFNQVLINLGRSFRAMVIPEIGVPLGGGTLSIKNTRVTDARLSGYDRHLEPPCRIRSRLYAPRLVGVGQWQFSRMHKGVQRPLASGAFRAMVVDAEISVVNHLTKTPDARPTIQMNECTAHLSHFRVEIDGFGQGTTVIEQCSNLLCKKVRSFFEDEFCNTIRNNIKENIDRKFFPSRINLGPSDHFVLNYDLLGEPKINEKSIQASLVGNVLSNGSSTIPFFAPDLRVSSSKDRSLTFLLSDYAFNTLLYHVHHGQYRFSAHDLLPPSKIRDFLKLQCSTAKIDSGAPPKCLGQIFGVTTLNNDSTDGMGDLVFKSQQPMQIILGSKTSSFGADGGMIEAFGAVGSGGKREVLGRADVRWIRGGFTPKMNKCNITGQVTIDNLHLTRPSSESIQSPTPIPSESTLSNLARLSIPVLTEMFNRFLNQHAQFPIPLISGFECESPELTMAERTVHINSGLRVVSPLNKRDGHD